MMRYLSALVCLSYGVFGAYRFYAWQARSPLPFVAPGAVPEALSVGVVGAIILVLAGAAGTYFLVFVNPKVTDYLIEVESEMRKVYWPKVKPWFSWSSELWGSAYVVIVVVVVISVFIQVVDLVFTPVYQWIFK